MHPFYQKQFAAILLQVFFSTGSLDEIDWMDWVELQIRILF